MLPSSVLSALLFGPKWPGVHARLKKIEQRLEQGSAVLDKHASLYGRLYAKVDRIQTNLTDMFTTAGIHFRVLW